MMVRPLVLPPAISWPRHQDNLRTESSIGGVVRAISAGVQPDSAGACGATLVLVASPTVARLGLNPMLRTNDDEIMMDRRIA